MSSQMKTLIGVVIVAIIAIGGYLFLKKPAEEAAPTAEAPAATTTEPAATTTAAAPATKGPQTVAGPSMLPECFKPYAADTKFFQWAKKDGPYRIALANGFVGNTWRIQMIKTAKAFVEAADVKPDVKELKVVCTGTDVAAQIAAIDNFINSGYDAIVTIAVNPTAFDTGDQARQRSRRRARAVRQRHRQQGRDAGQRGSAGDGPPDGPTG